jgi:formylglycine-generating enzyme required for sulfatase activity
MTGGTTRAQWIIAVAHGGRRYEFADADLPVVLGAGAEVDVPLDGVTGTLQLGRLGDVFFVQAGRGARNVRIDGAPLAGSRPLRDGDVVAFDRARLQCRVAGATLEVGVEMLVTAGDTAPPDLEVMARGNDAGSDVAITPIAFKPASSRQREARTGPSKTTIAAYTALTVLAVCAWFAFTAKSVALHIEPAPETLSLPDTVFKLKFGDRFLLRPGSHRVAAELAGHYPLDASFDVGSGTDQAVALEFVKLPGLVTLTTVPEVAAEVLLDGVLLGTTPLTDAELTPGVHRIELRAARFLPEVRELDVRGGGERQALAATLTPNWAPVTLATQPAGATILVDGEPAGTTPAVLELPAGERTLEARLSGYNAWTSKVLVAANEAQTLPNVTLALADGRVDIASVPTEASVSIDGEFRGRTPLQLRLSPGRTHRLSLSKPGYEQATRDLSVAADSGRRFEIALDAQYGDVELVSEPANAEVWIDGERRGATPTTVRLTALRHEVELRQEGFAVARVDVTPRPGFPQKVERALTALDSRSGSGFAAKLTTSQGKDLVLVSAGQFTMGSSRREAGRRSNEVLRPVRLTHAFYLGTHEVTNAEFREFKASHDSGVFAGQSLNGDDQPVVNVGWNEVAQFLNWLSIKDGFQPVYEDRQGVWAAVRPLRNGYRLPTEAEWEWAARFAGQQNGLLYPWGNGLPPPDRFANLGDVAAAEILPTTLVTYDDGFAATAPAGSFAANAVGIHDLGGNVAEWVQDFYSIDAIEGTEREDDPLGPEVGRFHVVRGPSWRSATVTDLRTAARGYGLDAREDLGFRIARSLQ